MSATSFTSEELPRCPVCGERALLELCDPAGLALCPRCGSLLCWFRRRFARSASVNLIRLETTLAELGADSLDIVEFLMELEEGFGVTIPDDVVERLTTIESVIRHIERSRKEDAA
ncbi:MAG TPA: phosphopantetheine-binding protein [Gemmataceae bacterium]|nr:phosphopantetheine-binding protein [Gemmataceae bacterium]